MNWLTNLWDRWNRIPAPVATDSPVIAPPALKQEQFADLQAHTQVRQEREHHLHLRVIAGNNRNVTRNYGHGDVDETFAYRGYAEIASAPLSDAEIAEAAALGMELKVVDEKVIDLRDAKSFQKLREQSLLLRQRQAEEAAMRRYLDQAP